jgi:osmoprotectant transport system permease protein
VRCRWLWFLVVSVGCTRAPAGDVPATSLTVGSKKFTESVILAEMVAQLAEHDGAHVQRRHQLGGTQVLWRALVSGAIDVYPEYTGTISEEVLAGRNVRGEDAIRQELAKQGIRMSRSLGFNDTYAIGMKEDVALRLGIRTLSDLQRHPEVKFGFSNEFMKRGDGWPSLRDEYHLAPQEVRGLDHDLAYIALDNGTIDATDLYSTDAEIEYYHLRVLEDDQHYFPAYRAVLLYREDLEARAPDVVKSILGLEGRISEAQMASMNALVKRKQDRIPASRVAGQFLGQTLGIGVSVQSVEAIARFWRHTKEHLRLVLVSLAAAIMVSVPLGVLAARNPALGQVLLGTTGVLQTIPSLALMVFLIPVLGLGAPPAIVALFLYSLLPILRNTYTGLRDIAPSIRESAEALGMTRVARLWSVELPMASRAILAGIKTSAVINVGTATLGALIGAGGYGEPILTGIMLNDYQEIMWGAVPAAGMALLVQWFFEFADRYFVPKGLRLKPAR